MNNHTDLLNYLIELRGLKSYLEIGVQNPANNFDKIKSKDKIGVDPVETNRYNINCCTSDKFFEKYNTMHDPFDLIFLDGLHTEEQIQRDFENSLKCLSDNGIIVIHDTLPETEYGTEVPRVARKWWGNVYLFAMTLSKYENINFLTIDFDCGCTVVWKEPYKPDAVIPHELNWQTYQQYKKQLLRIVSVKEFIEIFSQVESIE